MSNTENFNKVLEVLKEYYKDKPYPKTGLEYKKDFPVGFSNSTLCTKYKVKCRELLDELNNIPKKKEFPKSFEGILALCKEWEQETGLKVPQTQGEWGRKSYTKNEVPVPSYIFTREGISTLAVIKALHPHNTRKVPEKHNIQEFAEGMGVEILELAYPNVTYRCSNCKNTETTTRDSFNNRAKMGIKFCFNFCNTLPGKTKPIGYYQQFLTEEFVVESLEDKKLSIKHTNCGNTISRDIRHVTRGIKDTNNSLVCEYCSGGAIKEEGFTSLIEKTVITHLIHCFPELEMEREVMYHKLVDTQRKYRADVYYPELNLVLEITSRNVKFEGYSKNLEEKLLLLHTHGVQAYKVVCSKDAEDIVRALVKAKEK